MSDGDYRVCRMGVTLKQKMVLEFVTKYCAKHGYSPSYQEIAEAVGIASKSGVKRLVDSLVERGRLEKLPRRARSVVVT
jgi:SOS-response transcriptional repressor LexA